MVGPLLPHPQSRDDRLLVAEALDALAFGNLAGRIEKMASVLNGSRHVLSLSRLSLVVMCARSGAVLAGTRRDDAEGSSRGTLASARLSWAVSLPRLRSRARASRAAQAGIRTAFPQLGVR